MRAAPRAARRGRPGAAVPRDAEDDPRSGHARLVRADGVREVVARAAQRVDGPGGRRAADPVVVAHDEDRVRGPPPDRCLERVVPDVRRRVVRDLVAGADLVELAAQGPEQRDELVPVAAGERLEVEVDAVGAAVADGGDDLPREVGAGRGAAEERALDARLAARPREHAHREHDPGALAVGRVDHARSCSSSSSRPSRSSRVPSASRFLRLPLRVAPTEK